MPVPKVKPPSKKKTIYDENGNWTVFQHQESLRKLENPLFTQYYRDTQRLTGGDAVKYAALEDSLRVPLESSVWINETDPLASDVSQYFSSLPPGSVSPIPWYPREGMGWRIHCDKVQLRKSPELKGLRQFMIAQTAIGTISRQEEVSMIPPFLLDIQKNDFCLDMCASPGSKTAQILVELARQKKSPEGSTNEFPFDYLSEGLVVANELDTPRANMLVHQVKRLRALFPFAAFSNHDARFFPRLGTAEDPITFDKILCDVVCSGDGTLRKSPFIFKVWSPREAIGLQKTQVQIALRASYLLKTGGRLVYSTCSMNPIENEAVVSQIVARTGGAMKLVAVADKLLPGLRFEPGLTTWQVTDNNGKILQRDSPEAPHEALFPLDPPQPDLDLTKCMRLYPEHCGGGGFFIAVLDKVSPWDFSQIVSYISKRPREQTESKKENKAEKETSETNATRSDTTAMAPAGDDADSALAAVESENPEATEAAGTSEAKPLRLPPQFVAPTQQMLSAITDFYEASDFPLDNLVVRTPFGEQELKADAMTNVNFVSNSVLRLLRTKTDKVRIVSAGLRTLAREYLVHGWRITYEGTPLFVKFLERHPARLMTVPSDFILKLMVSGKLKDLVFPNIPEPERSAFEALPVGTVLVKVRARDCRMVTAVVLRARARVQLLVDHEDVVELQLRLGITDDEIAKARADYEAREREKDEAAAAAGTDDVKNEESSQQQQRPSSESD